MWIRHSSPGFTVIVFRYLFTLEVTGNASHEESQWDGLLLAIALNKRMKPYTQSWISLSVGERTEYEVWVCVGNHEKRTCVCVVVRGHVFSCINPWSIHALLHQAYDYATICLRLVRLWVVCAFCLGILVGVRMLNRVWMRSFGGLVACRRITRCSWLDAIFNSQFFLQNVVPD